MARPLSGRFPRSPPRCSSRATQASCLPMASLSIPHPAPSTVQMKLPVIETMMDCLYATCHPIVTDCVMAELEKLGPKFRLALRVARDPRFERHKCTHKGVYADDCLVSKVSKDRVYLVATNDKGLVSRLRRIPGVPIMKCGRGKYTIERLPDAPI
ncbi:hypothetical protein CaCOL14_004233 [Colletotrichum acutatum]